MTIEEFKTYVREWLAPYIEGANEDPAADAVVRQAIKEELEAAIRKLEGA